MQYASLTYTPSVVVVEPDQRSRHALSMALESGGYMVFAVGRATQARLVVRAARALTTLLMSCQAGDAQNEELARWTRGMRPEVGLVVVCEQHVDLMPYPDGTVALRHPFNLSSLLRAAADARVLAARIR